MKFKTGDKVNDNKEVQFTLDNICDGDIITLRNGDRFECYNEKLIDIKITNSNIVTDLSDFDDELEFSYDYDIIKIERPIGYKNVYERPQDIDILDETEKKYLSNLIRPFKNKVESITKYNTTPKDEYISIGLEYENNIILPCFKSNAMYKGMKLGKEYSLKELGLEKKNNGYIKNS